MGRGGLPLPHQLLLPLRQPVLQHLLHDRHVRHTVPSHRVPSAEPAAGDGEQIPHRMCVHLDFLQPFDVLFPDVRSAR